MSIKPNDDKEVKQLTKIPATAPTGRSTGTVVIGVVRGGLHRILLIFPSCQQGTQNSKDKLHILHNQLHIVRMQQQTVCKPCTVFIFNIGFCSLKLCPQSMCATVSPLFE